MLHLTAYHGASPLCRAFELSDDVQDTDGPRDGAEGIAQLVTEHGEKFVLGAAGRAQRFLALLLLRDVAPHRRNADDPAGFVPDRRNSECHLDGAAVFPDAYGFERTILAARDCLEHLR